MCLRRIPQGRQCRDCWNDVSIQSHLTIRRPTKEMGGPVCKPQDTVACASGFSEKHGYALRSWKINVSDLRTLFTVPSSFLKLFSSP